MSETQEYGGTAKALHWLVFALLAAQYAIGWLMPHIGRDTPNAGWVAWHLGVGATILFIVVARFAWRQIYPVGMPATLQAWERQVAHATHLALYGLLVVILVLGWAGASFRGYEVTLFGAVPLPALAAKGTPWAHTAGDIHITLVYVLLGLIALHVLGALYHHFIKHDGVLQRMLPGKR